MDIQRTMNSDRLEKIIIMALDKFKRVDRELLSGNNQIFVKEECINHRIATHIGAAIKNYGSAELVNLYSNNLVFLDCEYDKHLEKRKEMNGVKIRPDIVLHQRNSDSRNLIYLEVKKRYRSRWDVQKARAACISPYNYKYAGIVDKLVFESGYRLERIFPS